MAICSSCGGPRDIGSRSGLCRSCKFPPRPDRFCVMDCGAKLGRHNKSGACRKCSLKATLRDPAIEAKRIDRLAKSNSDVELNKLRTSFLLAEARSAKGRKRRADLRRQKVAWCPPHYRRAYQLLMRGGKRAEEAKRIILQRMQEEMTPFERQLEAIRRGAGIIEVRPISRSLSGSLYGNASAMCAEAAL